MAKPSPPPPLTTEPTKRRRAKFKLSEGILVAIASTGSYFLTYEFEVGFASYFRIPTELVSVSLVNVFFLTVLVAGAIATFFFSYFFTFRWVFDIKIFQKLIRNRNRVTVWLSVQPLSLKILLAFVVFFVPVRWLPPILGERIAKNQTEFLVIHSTPEMPEMVVLRVYGDTLILAPLDRKRQEVQMIFTVVKISDLKSPLRNEDVGPLKPMAPIEPKQETTPSATPTPRLKPTGAILG